MDYIYMADVGDGLCLAIRTPFRDFIQIDCGSIQGSRIAVNGLERICNHFHETQNIFILSHFHIDHYNGLLSLSNNIHPLSFEIKEVYFPKIPEFKQKVEFTEALFTMNFLIFGNETGLMEYDFLKAISKISSTSFEYRALSQGDKININNSIFEVIWPPNQITEGKILKIIEKALSDFNEALKKDEQLNKLYQQIKEEKVFKKYFEERRVFENDNKQNKNIETFKKDKNILPGIVKKANNSLRKAANHLSLAFFGDNKILFMGDLENYEIKEVINYLKRNNKRLSFNIFIPSHHGTHWHKALKEINWHYSLVSNGPKLCRKMSPYLKENSKRSLSTHANSDIIIILIPEMSYL